MIITFSPQVKLPDNDYLFIKVKGDILYVKYEDREEEYDFTQMGKGELQSVESTNISIEPLYEARRTDTELYITLYRPIPPTDDSSLNFPEDIDTSEYDLSEYDKDPLYIYLEEHYPGNEVPEVPTEPGEEPVEEPTEPEEVGDENISFEVIDEVEEVIEGEVEFEEVEDTIVHETEKTEQELLEEQGILPEVEPPTPIEEGVTETTPTEPEQPEEPETEEPQEPQEPELTEEEIAMNNEMERQAIIMGMGYDLEDPEVIDKTLEEIIIMEEEWSRKRKEEEEQREREYQEWLDSLPKSEPTEDIVVLPDGEIIVVGEDEEVDEYTSDEETALEGNTDVGSEVDNNG